MPELTKVDPVKSVGFVKTTSGYENRRQQRKLEEEELERAIEDLEGKGKEDEADTVTSETDSKTDAKESKETEPLSAEERTFKKRYGDLRRHSQEQTDQSKKLQEQIDSLKEQLKGGSFAAPTSQEDITAWVEKNPNVAGIVEAIAERKANEKFESTNRKFEEFEAEKHEMVLSRTLASVLKVHSDFESLSASDDFHDWIETQPKMLQDAIFENDSNPESAVRVIDLYKMDKGLTSSAKKEAAKKAASSVKATSTADMDLNGSSKQIKESDVAKMSDVQFEKNLEKIEKAQREGNFIYDVTGGAR